MDFVPNYSNFDEGNQVYFDDAFLDEIPQLLPDLAQNTDNHGDELANKDSNNSAENTTNNDANNACYDIVKGQWTSEEDNLLIDLVKKHGEKWSKIAAEFKTRSGKQCRERWIYHYRPDIKENKWTEEEEKILIDAHRELGNKWSTICKRLPGRTDNAIKNYFNKTRRKNLAKRSSCKSRPKSPLQEYITSLPEYNFPVKSPAMRKNSGETTECYNTEPIACPNVAEDAIHGNCISSYVPNPSCDNSADDQAYFSTFVAEDVLLGSSAPNPSPHDYIYQPNFMHGFDNNNDPYINELACIVEGFGGSNNIITPSPNPNPNPNPGPNPNPNPDSNPSASLNTNEYLTAERPTQPFLGSDIYDNSADPHGDELASLIAGFTCGSSTPQYVNEWEISMGSANSTTVQAAETQFVDGNPTQIDHLSDKKGKAKMPGYF